jgi:hypothetical protein
MAIQILQNVLTGVIKHSTSYYDRQPLQEADDPAMTDDLSLSDNSGLASYILPERIVKLTFTNELKENIKCTNTMTKTSKQVFLNRLH